MPYNGKSPAQINLAAMFGGAAKGNLSEAQVAKLEGMAGRNGAFGNVAQKFLNKYQASQASATSAGAGAATAPSVVQTAGATNMGQRINTIESRLQALEGSGTTAGAAQPAEVAPSETQAQAAASQMMGANQTTPEQAGVSMSGAMIGAAQPQIPPAAGQAVAVSEQLGNLMASPFMVRQRKNMGPLMFKDQTGDGKITRADVIKARVEGYKK